MTCRGRLLKSLDNNDLSILGKQYGASTSKDKALSPKQTHKEWLTLHSK